ncbi:hypothetical protein DEO72_LG11g2561 [Vigna unguiculata]|uniref:Uncharacterized protein n=1 Tax=Vigna unguiculata TaxID=3917 RepID=A0A4D6NNU9_VIGUN|nr:hypothetical protein DEO72_LG11g2561 [Vigna unguiculata]
MVIDFLYHIGTLYMSNLSKEGQLSTLNFVRKTVVLALEPQPPSTSTRVWYHREHASSNQSSFPTFQPLVSSLELLRSAVWGQDRVRVIFQVGKLRHCSYVPFSSWFGCCFEFVWKTVARPANLAQASQSRLGEMSRGSPKPYYARGRLGDPLIIFERASISSKREVHNSLGSLGETSMVALQWSGRNSMAPLGGEQRYPPQVQASVESDHGYMYPDESSRVVVYCLDRHNMLG